MKVSRFLICAVVALTLSMLGANSAMAQNTVTVTTGAALEGTYGMQLDMYNVTNKAYVVDNSPSGETVYRAQFLFKKNTWMLNDTQKRTTVFLGRQDMGGGVKRTVMRCMMIRTVHFGYIMRVAVRKDDGFWKHCGDWTLPTATGPASVREVRIEWKAATAPGADDGYCRSHSNGNLKLEVTDIDNDGVAIDQVWLGLTEGNMAAASGTGYFDSFESYRTVNP
jgi:hypothetical protein